MSFLRSNGWRLSLLVGGLLMAAGGPMHPEADASDSLTQGLATMTADAAWIPGHALIMVGTLFVVAGLWLARSRGVWPGAERAVTAAAVTMSLYAVETVFHLAAAADQAALAAGELPPITLTHLALSIVLYPLSGTGLVLLGTYLMITQRGVRRVLPVVAVVAGVLHAASVPTTMLLPDLDARLLFAGAGMGLALWAIGTAVLGVRRTRAVAADVALQPAV